MVSLLFCLCSVNCILSPFHRIPEQDRSILYRAAAEYRLAGESRRLLFALYLVERGAIGREMGVLHPRAQRFKDNRDKSLRLQAQWAAGTIRKRYTGDLEAFAVRWCPLNDPADKRGLNHHWLPNVRSLMQQGGAR